MERSTTPTLGYEAGAGRPRRRWVRYAVILVVAGALAVVGMRYGPGLLARARVVTEQKAWLDYAAPADQVVILEDWRRGFLGLLQNEVEGQSDPGLVTVEWLDHTTATVAARPLAGLDAFLARQGMSPAARRDRYGTEARPTPVLFCGERTSAAGRRLIRVSYRAKTFRVRDNWNGFEWRVEVYEPATLAAPLRLVSSNHAYVGRYPIEPPQVVRIYAGQRDPADPARVTFRYDLGKGGGTIEAVLAPDGKTVTLRTVSGDLGQ